MDTQGHAICLVMFVLTQEEFVCFYALFMSCYAICILRSWDDSVTAMGVTANALDLKDEVRCFSKTISQAIRHMETFSQEFTPR